MRGYRQFALYTAASFFVIVAAEWLRFVVRSADKPVVDRILGLLAFLIFFALLAVWGISIRQRVMWDHLRRPLLGAAFMILFWLLVRSARYFFGGSIEGLSRFLWYLYYVPMVTLPLLAFFISLSIGKPEDRRPAAPWFLLWGAAAGLIALVLTNDMHHFVFFLPSEGDPSSLISRSEEIPYAYGWGYIVIAAWIILLELASILLIIYKGRGTLSRRRVLLPLLVFAAAVLYWLGYWRFPEQTGVGFIELTVGISWFSVLIWESCIQIGLIPVNTRYADFFHHATIHMQITDPQGTALLSSADAQAVPAETFARLRRERTVALDPDTELHLYPVNCGYSVWQEDVHILTEMIGELRMNAEELREGNTIAQREYLADRRRSRIREKTRLYSVISNALQGDFDRLRAMVDALDGETDPEKRRAMLAGINLEGVFLKRAGNAIMMSEGNEKITGDEISLCFAELRENMRLCGYELRFNVSLSGPLSLTETLAAYAFLRDISGLVSGRASSLYVLLTDVGDDLRIVATAAFSPDGFNEFVALPPPDLPFPPQFDTEERTAAYRRILRKEADV